MLVVVRDLNNSNKYKLEYVEGFIPVNYVCNAPEGFTLEDSNFLIVINNQFCIDEPKKNDYLTKEQEKRALKEYLASLPKEIESDRKWRQVREERDRRLTACDWTQLSDAPFNSEQKQIWRNYRHSLRNVPQQTGDPESIIWPEKPEV